MASTVALIALSFILILSVLAEKLARSFHIPPIVSYILLGVLSRFGLEFFGHLNQGVDEIFKFLADIGIACLLFRVGLKCQLHKLLKQLKSATIVWVGDFTISFGFGFVLCFVFLQFALVPSLIIGTAFTATSLGVAVAIWEQKNKLNTDTGQLMVDVAELDDISGVLFLGLVFTIIPVFDHPNGINLALELSHKIGVFLLSVFIFGAVCFLFSHYAEKRISDFFKKNSRSANSVVLIVGTVLAISVLAKMIGIGIAIGAFFTGLMFSRDSEALRIDASFDKIYAFFAPFFFIHIGMMFDYKFAGPALGIGMILVVAASLAKVFGNALPTYLLRNGHAPILLGVSMIPRAEIALVIAENGRMLGPWALSNKFFSAIVIMALGTSILSPILVSYEMRRLENNRF